MDLGVANTVSVGDIEGALAIGGRVDTSGAAGLEAHLAQDILEVRAGGELGDLSNNTSWRAKSMTFTPH